MKYAICIPNYNYEKFVVAAVRSALDQGVPNIEVVVRDNASTDRSVEVVKAIQDSRVRIEVNACNVGYAGNLDRTVRMSTGEVVVVLCADDLFRPGYLPALEKLYARLGPADAARAVVSTTNEVVDPQDQVTGAYGPAKHVWLDSDRAPELDALVGGPVYRVPAHELLRRCLKSMTNPFNMSTTAYPRGLYEKLEGYGGGRTFNPDKWFHWRLLGEAGDAFFIDAPLGASRWHPNNQTAQQASSGALKYLVDDYVSTFELDRGLLERVGVERAEVEESFIEYDIARHGLATLAGGNRAKAERIATFGDAVFPQHARKNQKLWALKALLATGPVGGALAKTAYLAYSERRK